MTEATYGQNIFIFFYMHELSHIQPYLIVNAYTRIVIEMRLNLFLQDANKVSY